MGGGPEGQDMQIMGSHKLCKMKSCYVYVCLQ